MNTGTKDGKSVVNPEWVDEEMMENIKQRRFYNKKHRKAKKKKLRNQQMPTISI